jgi:hypothetical protein
MTRKIAVGTLALMLVGAALPAFARSTKAREASGEYNAVTVDTDNPGSIAAGRVSNGVTFKVRKGERFVSVAIADKSEMPTRAVVGQDLDGDGLEDVSQEICGASTAPIALKKGADVTVWTQEGPCEDGTNATATFGTVTATFTR